MYGQNVLIGGQLISTALNPLGTLAGFIIEKNVIFETHYTYIVTANSYRSNACFVQYVEVPNYVAAV